MAKNKRSGRRVSGNPAKAAEVLRAAQAEQHFRREVEAQSVPAYRSPTPADWARLEREARAVHPKCPECGGPLVGDSQDNGEEGGDDEGRTVISMVLWCERFDDESEASADAALPHPLTHGMVEHELVLT